ncbi:MAG: FAD-binding oxidoreductase [Melioribacteraceae bacterium]|nr:MAG: FAD-binding oxidoreductase [Melioribacteraceae bacterium]
MKCKILMTEFVTHDVKSFIVEKPKDYTFNPGQATEVNIDDDKWRKEKRPFTFTSMAEDEVLQFIVKKYPDHEGVTDKMHELKSGDKIEIGDAWGAIQYEGKGVFIAGGAGVTPFIAILRDLKTKGEIEGNKLLFSNKEERDIILEKEFKDLLGDDFITTLTQEKNTKHHNGRIDEQFLKNNVKDFSQNFYVCGPPKFIESITQILKNLGAEPDSVVIEE